MNDLNNYTQTLRCKNCGSLGRRKGLFICQICYDANLKLMFEIEKNRKVFYPEIDQINQNIYLGNYDGQKEKDKLKEYGIKGIMVCGSFLNTFHPEEFTYLVFDIDDSLYQNIEEYFDKAYDFIEKIEKVYVHCAAGISRSSSFVIAYLMRKNNWSFEKSYEYVQSKRDIICPNSNFVKQLKEYGIKLTNNNLG